MLIVFAASMVLLGLAQGVSVVRAIVRKDTIAYVTMSFAFLALLLMSFYAWSNMLPGTSVLLVGIYTFISGYMSFTKFTWARQHLPPRFCPSAA